MSKPLERSLVDARIACGNDAAAMFCTIAVPIRNHAARTFDERLRLTAPATVVDKDPGRVDLKIAQAGIAQLGIGDDMRRFVEHDPGIDLAKADREARRARQDRVAGAEVQQQLLVASLRVEADYPGQPPSVCLIDRS